MKVVAINGSTRKNGNTDIMINEVFNVLKENNIEVIDDMNYFKGDK